MSTGKTFFGKIIAFIGHFLAGILHIGRQVLDALPPAVKDSILHGTGIVSIISNAIENTADEVRKLIADKFPNLNETQLEQSLISVAHTFNLGIGINSLEDAITALQDYFATHNDNASDQVRHAIAVALAHNLAPEGTHIANITTTIEAAHQSENNS